MLDIKEKSKLHVHWKVTPYDYSKEKENIIIEKFSKKYGIKLKSSRDRLSYLHPDREKYTSARQLGTLFDLGSSTLSRKLMQKLTRR